MSVKKRHVHERDQIWNLASCSFENGKYLGSITDNSVNMCNEIIEEETKTVTTNFNEKKKTKKNAICKTRFFYILLAFSLINIALWIAVSIYCYLLKYGAKQKHVLRFHNTNNELNQVSY